MKYCQAEEAVKVIKSGQRVFVHGAAATPELLLNALADRHHELRDVEIVQLHTEGQARYAMPEYAHAFRVNCFFIGPNIRPYVAQTNVQYVPVFLSEIPALFSRGILPLDVALIHVSTPDQHGFCSLGVSVDIARSAVDHARHIVALVNPNMPRTHGDGLIHQSRIHTGVYAEVPLFEHPPPTLTPLEEAIGRNVAELVEDGSTLQMGIGGIPDAVLGCLQNHKDLGVHSEMFSDGVLRLVQSGVITGLKKNRHIGKIVSSFVMGSRTLYDFIDDNPMVAMLDVSYVNNASVISRLPKMVAINSALQVDLSGQVCADSIGSRMFSGVGGQMDFIRGASMSPGGKPIIAMPSATRTGISKIVPYLTQGAGVVTTRAHVHYIATEYGVAHLYGMNLAQRAQALIAIAHPDARAELEREAYTLYGKFW